MKGRSISILGIIVAAVGAVFIIGCSSLTMHILAISIAVIFVAAGLIDLIVSGIASRKTEQSVMSFLGSAAALVLGVTMLTYSRDFEPMMPFMLSILVGECALWQFITLGLSTRPFQLPAWLYVFPLALTAGAIYIYIIKDSGDSHLLLLSSGIAMAVLGAGCLFEGSLLGVARRRHNKEMAQAATAGDTTPAAEAEAPASRPKKRVETTEDLDDQVE